MTKIATVDKAPLSLLFDVPHPLLEKFLQRFSSGKEVLSSVRLNTCNFEADKSFPPRLN